MSIFSIKQFLVLSVLLFALQACGSDEEASTENTQTMSGDMETATVPKAEMEASSTPEPELVPMPAAELMHAVVYEEEIYANWPE